MEPVVGIEPTTCCYETAALPLSYTGMRGLANRHTFAAKRVLTVSSDSKQVKIARQLALLVPYYLMPDYSCLV